ncbi:ATP-binding protein [Bifidobacterium sp. MA2]|uniref:ATP-binding protein n=1 Tax=Bifidobacterium santillanense TaxID=2809028 RepID=A0ABS5UQM2_9BIFI|nr:AAA family ATPase [Bifidobacterium santillanense]MBT1173189.1 ATP-binding protein [Bifidobacterium santillanense]
MVYLKRKADDFLTAWKADPDRKPLIVKGPRQVGKTETIRRFAAGAYANVVEINFVEEPKYRAITTDGYGADAIIRNISLLDPSKRFIPGETLLFFDEIQSHPDIATALKFLRIDGRFDVICSGSMLGISYREIESNSVGYKTDYEMYSMDFEEFLWAKGYGEDVADGMLEHLTQARPFSQVEMDVYSSAFLDYCVLGGMPAVVTPYIESGTFSGTLQTQRQLVADYQEDIRKYATGLDQARILNVFRHIPVQLARENKKFQISKVASGARFKDYRGCVEWLETSGMANVCRCLTYPELPLRGNYDENKFKIYFGDTGLFVAMLDDEASDDLRANRNLGVYKGAMYESIVAEALRKAGYELYYYKKEDSTLEQDFFVRTREWLVPIEVKARKGTAKSMRTLIASDSYPEIRFGIKLSAGNIGSSEHVFSAPYFTTFLMRRLLRAYDEGDAPLLDNPER